MVEVKNYTIFKIISVVTGIIFIIITPWVNKDSMVVPKVMFLSFLALFLISSITLRSQYLTHTKIIKLLTVIIFLIIIQMSLVVFFTNAPIEQQIFGKMGRGLGFITATSILVVTLASALFVNQQGIYFFIKLFIFFTSISSIYSIFQSFGFDFIKWETKTNSVFGTLGNPNFQSTAAAMAIVPCIILFFSSPRKYFFMSALVVLNFMVIIKTGSVQGLVGFGLGISFCILLFLWFRNRYLFVISFLVLFTCFVLSVLAMVNQGPLRSIVVGPFTLYKASLQSRGDFWRSAFAVSESYPFFGIGLDSFGDYYMMYRDTVASSRINSEFTDNAHNYFLEYASTGGYPLLILYLFLIMLTIYAVVKIIKYSTGFDPIITSLFSIWIIFLAQSVISPGSISLMVINAVVTGSIIGFSQIKNLPSIKVSSHESIKSKLLIQRGIFLIFAGSILLFPYFNTDRLFLKALNSKDAIALAKSTHKYPESTLRYSTASRLLLESRVFDQSLTVARRAIEFNPNNVSPWAHILLNPLSTREEKLEAKRQLIRLDPSNTSLNDIKI